MGKNPAMSVREVKRGFQKRNRMEFAVGRKLSDMFEPILLKEKSQLFRSVVAGN
jgi:hypothetical protein